MNHLAQNLEIHLHKVDGSTDRFTQTDTSLAQRILDGFNPARIFSREMINLADGDSLTSFPVRQVTRIDLVSEPPSHLILPPGLVDAVELAETEFQSLLRNPELGSRWDDARALDASVIAFLELDMVGQPPLFLVEEVPLEPQADQSAAFLRPLATPALCFRMRTGGVAVLNLLHLMGFTLFPSPQEALLDAWPATRAGTLRLAYGPETSPATGDAHPFPLPGWRSSASCLTQAESQ